MIKNNILVPEVILDIVKNLETSTSQMHRDNYRMRLEAIIEFSQNALRKDEVKRDWIEKKRTKK